MRDTGQLTLLHVLALVSLSAAQQPVPYSSLETAPQVKPPVDPQLFKEIDLLRRDGFSTATQAILSLHLLDHAGQPAPRLHVGEFKLFVNGTERSVRLQAPGEWSSSSAPLVLLVFPPNQPILHGLAISQATKYFASQPSQLSWKVGILDADGSNTTYTDSRTILLAWLQTSDRKLHSFQYSTDWLSKAGNAISTMSNYNGPTILLSFNPLPPSVAGLESSAFEYEGPDALVNIAQIVGARIYIANVGGPDLFVPGGDASSHAGNSSASASTFFAYRSSAIRQTADDTMGGFSNSLRDLAGQINHDLNDNYALTFDLTAEDRDQGVPQVEVRLADRHQRLLVADVHPLPSPLSTQSNPISKDLMTAMWRAADHPVTSPDFRIFQHVDYFPLREGLQPVLPMSAVVEWVGYGPAPAHLAVAEYVQNVSLATSVLEREVESRWAIKGISWERDGHLYPGKYLWRVVLHDDAGKIFASADQKITVGPPPDPSLSVSSLVVGSSCRDVRASMLKRADLTPKERDTVQFTVDPMKAADCRLKPEPTSLFSNAVTLRAFLRLYPTGRLAKRLPESWTATFSLRAADGTIEFQQNIPFSIDSGSGLLASMQLPLDSSNIHPGPHTLEASVNGPGIRKQMTAMRSIDVAQEQVASRP